MDPAAVAAPAASAALAVEAGRWAIVARGGALHVVDREGALSRILPGTDLAGTRRGDAESLHRLPHRRSVLVSWPALGEWWEVSLDPDAPPVFDGLVHDHRMGEAIASPGLLTPRRIVLPGAWTRVAYLPPGGAWVGGLQGDAVVVVHLDVRRAIARFDLPQADLAASRVADGLWLVPHAGGTARIDIRRWVLLQAPR